MGTHNSMTYLKPKKWYMYPFQFIAKCQSKTIELQYEECNVRLFDIRLSFTKDGIPEFRHGYIPYKGDVYKVLEYLNSRKDPIKIRIILERGDDILFIKSINKFKTLYPNLSFYEGRRKCDWKKIIDLPDLNVIQLVGSMNGFKLWPWLYAKLYNKKNLKKYNDSECLIDFI